MSDRITIQFNWADSTITVLGSDGRPKTGKDRSNLLAIAMMLVSYEDPMALITAYEMTKYINEEGGLAAIARKEGW